MTSTSDFEWTVLTRAWSQVGSEGAAEAIRQRVIRQTRLLQVVLIGEIVLTVSILAAVAVVVASHRTATALGLGAAALGHSALIWAFTIWNRRGTWRPLAESTRAYLQLARERCLRERRSALFVIWLVAVEALALLAWVWSGDRPGLGAAPVLQWASPVAAFSGAIGWAIWLDARARTELARVSEIATALGIDPGAGPATAPIAS